MRVVGAALLLFVAACAHTPTSNDPGPALPVVDYVRTQEVLTPLPLRVSLPRKMGAEHVVVLFKPWGVRGWKQVELPRRGDTQTWSGEVSCREVSTVTGDTKYFFLALDEKGDVVGGSGSPNWPHLATIVGKLPEGAQSIEGERAPVRCHDVADCPPDFPGCPAYTMHRSACNSSRDCKDGESCAWDGYCGSPAANTDPTAVENLSEEQQLEAAVRAVTQRYRRTAKNCSKVELDPNVPSRMDVPNRITQFCQNAPAPTVIRAKVNGKDVEVERLYGSPAPTEKLAKHFADNGDAETLLFAVGKDGNVLGTSWRVFRDQVSLELGIPDMKEAEAASLLLSPKCKEDLREFVSLADAEGLGRSRALGGAVVQGAVAARSDLARHVGLRRRRCESEGAREAMDRRDGRRSDAGRR